ncbi:unnamed protein product, partial [Medioppia subpectinata]
RYSKYRACISGLHAGLRIAMERERCPAKSYTSRVIRAYGDKAVGSPLRSLCGTAADGKSRCPSNRRKSGILCQNIFGGSGGGLPSLGKLPGVGQCDAIVTAGVFNCMENYLPRNILSGFTGGSGGSGGNTDICCRYSKYRACISGLNAGLRIAMEQERCPSKSYTSRVIRAYGDSVIGAPLKSVCGTAADGKSRCPPNRTSKPKKRKTGAKPKPSAGSRRNGGGIDSQFPVNQFNPLGGQDLLGGGNPLGGIGSVFQRGTGTLGQGATSLFNQGAGAVGGATNPLANPLGNPLGHLGGMFQSGVDKVGQGASSIFGGVLGGGGGKRGSANAGNPITDLFKQGSDTLAQGASTILGGGGGLFGGGQGFGAGLPPL